MLFIPFELKEVVQSHCRFFMFWLFLMRKADIQLIIINVCIFLPFKIIYRNEKLVILIERMWIIAFAYRYLFIDKMCTIDLLNKSMGISHFSSTFSQAQKRTICHFLISNKSALHFVMPSLPYWFKFWEPGVCYFSNEL